MLCIKLSFVALLLSLHIYLYAVTTKCSMPGSAYRDWTNRDLDKNKYHNMIIEICDSSLQSSTSLEIKIRLLRNGHRTINFTYL